MRNQLVTQRPWQSSRESDLGQHIRLGLGEDRDGGRQKDRILANVVEALLGLCIGWMVYRHVESYSLSFHR